MTDDCRAIVIGSGPSGAAAALTLLERGIPVTMLESGQAFPPGLIVRAFGRNLFRKWAPNDEGYAYVASGERDVADARFTRPALLRPPRRLTDRR